MPQALTYVQHNEFDTVYHEHLSTFSVTSLAKLYRFFDMRIVDVQMNAVNGGSFAVTACRTGAPYESNSAVIEWMLREEEL